MKDKINQRSFLRMFIFVSMTLICQGSVSGMFTNTNLDLSKMGEDKAISLVFHPSNKAVLGIRAHQAKDNIVGIDQYNMVETDGALVFAGTDDKKWPNATAHVFYRLDSSNNTLFKNPKIDGDCINMTYEGVVDGKVEYQKPDGKTYYYRVAKPISGACEKITLPNNSDNAFDIDSDFSDGWIESTKYGKAEVLIIADIDNAHLILILDEDQMKDTGNMETDSPQKVPDGNKKAP